MQPIGRLVKWCVLMRPIWSLARWFIRLFRKPMRLLLKLSSPSYWLERIE